MTPRDCTLKNFVLQDLFSETGALKVRTSIGEECIHDFVVYVSCSQISFSLFPDVQNQESFLVFMQSSKSPTC